MRTIRTVAIVSEDRMITVSVPSDIPKGAHQVVIVIDEMVVVSNDGQQGESLDLTPHPVGLISDTLSFRREDLYDDG